METIGRMMNLNSARAEPCDLDLDLAILQE